MMVGAHIHAQSDQADPFRLQSQTLLEAVFAGEKDFAACSNHPLPGNAGATAVQCPCDLSSISGIARGIRDVAIGGNLAARDAANLS